MDWSWRNGLLLIRTYIMDIKQREQIRIIWSRQKGVIRIFSVYIPMNPNGNQTHVKLGKNGVSDLKYVAFAIEGSIQRKSWSNANIKNSQIKRIVPSKTSKIENKSINVKRQQFITYITVSNFQWIPPSTIWSFFKQFQTVPIYFFKVILSIATYSDTNTSYISILI